MKYIEPLITIDKSSWPSGEWQREFDFAYWIDESTNLDCAIVRNNNGCLCGYVGVPLDHPFYELPAGISNPLLSSINVHGGITYYKHSKDEFSVPSLNFKSLYWLGFDCNHAYDYSPNPRLNSFIRSYPSSSITYKNVDYVAQEINKLIKQITVKNNNPKPQIKDYIIHFGLTIDKNYCPKLVTTFTRFLPDKNNLTYTLTTNVDHFKYSPNPKSCEVIPTVQQLSFFLFKDITVVKSLNNKDYYYLQHESDVDYLVFTLDDVDFLIIED